MIYLDNITILLCFQRKDDVKEDCSDAIVPVDSQHVCGELPAAEVLDTGVVVRVSLPGVYPGCGCSQVRGEVSVQS